MRVAVTGGAGFIGSAVVNVLKEKQHDPYVLDTRNGFDVRSLHDATDALSDADAVIHLAGILGTHELFDDPFLAVDVNVNGTLTVLEACKKHRLRYVGITMPDVFPSIYTATKQAAMRLATAYHHTYGIPVSHVCAYNAYGSGQAHGPGHPQKIVPTFAVEAWQNRPIPIWGDGKQTVDLVHVDDLATVLVNALLLGDNEVLEGGTGEAHTVTRVAEMVLDITKSTAGIEYLPMRRGEIPTNIVAKRNAGYTPKWSMTKFTDTVRSYVVAA